VKAKLPEGAFNFLPTERNATVWNDIKAEYGLSSLEVSALQNEICLGIFLPQFPF
jgi:hypothetical protein